MVLHRTFRQNPNIDHCMESNQQVAELAAKEGIAKRLRSLSFSGNGKVVALLEKPAPGIHAARVSVEVKAGQGFTGDHNKKDFWRGERIPGREVTMIAKEVLEELGVDYLAIGDNVVCAGIDLASLESGQEIAIGTVRLKRAEKAHRQCHLFAQRTSQAAMEAVRESGTRGALFHVLTDGHISLQDVIELKK